jgi:hypothetical protein
MEIVPGLDFFDPGNYVINVSEWDHPGTGPQPGRETRVLD